jgi:hypothetical protein
VQCVTVIFDRDYTGRFIALWRPPLVEGFSRWHLLLVGVGRSVLSLVHISSLFLITAFLCTVGTFWDRTSVYMRMRA